MLGTWCLLYMYDWARQNQPYLSVKSRYYSYIHDL